MTRARENPLGDFVSEHPWISSLIGASAVGAAAWLGAFLASRAVGASPPVAGKGPKSTTSSTSTNDGATAPTSTSTTPAPTTTTTTTSTPTFDAAKVVTIEIPTGGKEVPVGTSMQVIDTHTGLPVAGECAPLSVLAPGPTDGTYVAIAPGTATIYPVSGAEGRFTIVVTPAVAGVSGLPPKRTLPRIIGIRALLGA